MRIDLQETGKLSRIKSHYLCFGNKNIIELLINKEYNRIIRKEKYNSSSIITKKRNIILYIKKQLMLGFTYKNISDDLSTTRGIIFGLNDQGLKYSIYDSQIDAMYKYIIKKT